MLLFWPAYHGRRLRDIGRYVPLSSLGEFLPFDDASTGWCAALGTSLTLPCPLRAATRLNRFGIRPLLWPSPFHRLLA